MAEASASAFAFASVAATAATAATDMIADGWMDYGASAFRAVVHAFWIRSFDIETDIETDVETKTTTMVSLAPAVLVRVAEVGVAEVDRASERRYYDIGLFHTVAGARAALAHAETLAARGFVDYPSLRHVLGGAALGPATEWRPSAALDEGGRSTHELSRTPHECATALAYRFSTAFFEFQHGRVNNVEALLTGLDDVPSHMEDWLLLVSRLILVTDARQHRRHAVDATALSKALKAPILDIVFRGVSMDPTRISAFRDDEADRAMSRFGFRLHLIRTWNLAAVPRGLPHEDPDRILEELGFGASAASADGVDRLVNDMLDDMISGGGVGR